MGELRRGVALAALTVAYVLGGPRREIVAAAEELAAVEQAGDRARSRRRLTDRVPGRRLRPRPPRGHGPSPTSPRS